MLDGNRRHSGRYALLLALGMLIGAGACTAQDSGEVDAAVDSEVVEIIRQVAESDLPDFGRQVEYAGSLLIGRPYVAGLLDESDEETLVTRIDAFDCVLLVESALALARAARNDVFSPEAYAKEIETMRYRAGQKDGYCSRLHYFSDWIADNEARGIVADITEDIGGIPYAPDINFMSSNRSLYSQIASDDSLYSGIVQVEGDLRDRQFHYIPQESIREAYPFLRSGDVIAITTAVAGLDVSHTGLAYVAEDTVGFLHASTSDGVTIAGDLSDYVNGNSRQTGIIVARPETPLD